MNHTKVPSLRNLTSCNYGKPAEKQNMLLKQLGAPHVQSFNYMVNKGLQQAIADMDPEHFSLSNNDRIALRIVNISLRYPQAPLGTVGIKDQRIFPTECRQRGATYKGKLIIKVAWSVNGVDQTTFDKDLGDIPIMIMSDRCHLNKLSPKQLVEHGEHEQEWGGYFVVKGLERLVRMLLMTRRNYPVAIKRSGWKGRGTLFSDYGISIRCVTEDQTATTNVLHFVTDGTAKLMFSHKKLLYYAPLVLVLKCLCEHWDYKIYEKLIQGYEDDLYYNDCIQKMLRNLHTENLHTHEECKNYLGNMFRIKFPECPEWYTDGQVAEFIIKRCILIHLNNPEDKFNLLIFMTQKLFAFAQNKCAVEGADSVMMQELLLGGHLYLQVIKDKLQTWLHYLHLGIVKQKRKTMNSSLTQAEILTAAKFTSGLQASTEIFLATGNLTSSSGLGLQQDKGLTIVAENINRMRYMSHFKSVHRGAFFQEMRTTEVRQLLPDAWGFICPVHTPDGAPCGLLNHLTVNCVVTDIPNQTKVNNIPVVLTELGMIPIKSHVSSTINVKEFYIVQLDGNVIGHVDKTIVKNVVNKLRLLKIKGEKVPSMLEIALVPIKTVKAQFAGLYLFTGPARMMRPVINLATKEIEFIGSFEQVYLDVCATPEEFYPGVTTHMELTKTDFMSNLANLIPMPDCNQSPRNMYQCQMGKQTMGTPCLNWNLQSETKLYRLQTPGSPLFRPAHYDNIELDDFAMGTNAIVAVISYTGYDMEDAMVINKSSYEFGFAHGSIYKSEFIELDHPDSYFCRDPQNVQLIEILDTDGLPFPGRIIQGREVICSYYSYEQSKYMLNYCAGKEGCYVDSIKICGNFNTGAKKIACITFRVPRNPSVGDKFASRAGQKGICSQKWPAEDLPFTETGLVPDIIFNPHGFPSRMTIAMMIELMAGKSAALHGLVHDATPFKFNDDDTAIDYFGRLLEAGGYNYYGTETMFSGIDGREIPAQIFFGVVHYQRLRHMVSDKWQVRSKGPIDVLTRQPIKGRKKGGGVRFGEMERDALISHGTSFLLQDRLFRCSDKVTALICTLCQTLLGPVMIIASKADKPHLTETKETCRLCKNADNISQIEIPYIVKYFISQLAACNINVKINCENV